MMYMAYPVLLAVRMRLEEAGEFVMDMSATGSVQ